LKTGENYEMKIKKETGKMKLNSMGYSFKLEDENLVITKNGKRFMRFPLIPKVEGESYKAEQWEQVEKECFKMNVKALGSIYVAIREGYVCYWIETTRKHFSKLTYFPNSHPTDIGCHTFLSDELDRHWSIDENFDVPLSSAYLDMHVDKEDGAGMTDPGDKPPTWIWNIPVRALAIEGKVSWMGLSIPGPLSVGVTRLTMKRGKFNITFEELRPTAREWGPPRVYFIPGLTDPYDTLNHHRIISEQCGLMNKEIKSHPEWWTYPPFKAADEIHRLNKGKWMNVDAEGNAATALTTENWLKWTEHVENYAGIKGKTNLELDQIYFYGYGGKKAVNTLGGTEGLRKTIDVLRGKGIHVGLYINLYMLDPTATDFPDKHPEAICKKKDPSTVIKHGCAVGSQDMVYVDWTHPLGREYMMSLVEWLLSDKPGCLNADWLLINNNLAVDPRRFEFYDPDWGIGDLMSMKATKLAYEKAKQIKPDCLVRRQSPADCYMQPYCDISNMCEEWNGQTTAWYRRARIATRTLYNVIYSIDSWFVTLTKLTEYYFGLAAFTLPEISSVEHAIHPYIKHRKMRPKDYKRIRGAIQTYMNAPIKKGDESCLNCKNIDNPEIWRKHCEGKLKGWYAAIGLTKRCFVTYSEREARLCSSQERRVVVPLPPGAKLKDVYAIPHKGKASSYAYEKIVEKGQNKLRLWALDAGEEIMYITVKYVF